ncbi:MAG: polymerase, sigma-24 subunit, subfamily [Frankiales bacterium]|nr:polymerase, sigma-24 subunit, subfamily [Frankiales bacterium]
MPLPAPTPRSHAATTGPVPDQRTAGGHTAQTSALACTYCLSAVPPESFAFRSSLRRLLYADCPACSRLVTVTAASWRRRVGTAASAVPSRDGDGRALTDRAQRGGGPPPAPAGAVVAPALADHGEASLLRGAVDGDRAAWDGLVELHLEDVWNLVAEQGTVGQDAAQVCQVVWLRLAQQLPRLAEDPVQDAVGDWLHHQVVEECSGRAALRSRERPPVVVPRQAVRRAERGPEV